MRVLIFGVTGQIGVELKKLISSSVNLLCPLRYDCDFYDLKNLETYVFKFNPDLIINAVAFNNVDATELDAKPAEYLNISAPKILAHICYKLDIPLIHFSSNYIFDGMNEYPYQEEDKPIPLSVYGKTKLMGEEVIRDSGCNHIILRIGWIYSLYRENFLKTIIRLSKEKKELYIADNQYGTPTSAKFVASIVGLLIKTLLSDKNNINIKETFHLCPEGYVSRFDYVKFIIETLNNLDVQLQFDLQYVHPINLDQYPMAAERPLNACLDGKKLAQALHMEFPSWQEDLNLTIRQLTLIN